jgi:hypothetical protein
MAINTARSESKMTQLTTFAEVLEGSDAADTGDTAGAGAFDWLCAVTVFAALGLALFVVFAVMGAIGFKGVAVVAAAIGAAGLEGAGVAAPAGFDITGATAATDAVGCGIPDAASAAEVPG